MRDNDKVRIIMITLIAIVFATALINGAILIRHWNHTPGTMRFYLLISEIISIIVLALLNVFYSILTRKNGIILRLDDALIRSLKNEEKLKEEKSDLEIQLRHTQKLETIGTLAGGMAHDFNNLLSPILGYSDLALSQLSQDDTLYLYINEIVRAAGKAKEQVEMVLRFNNQSKDKKQDIDITAIVEETAMIMRPLLPSTVSIKLELDDEISYVKADPEAVNQILVNLCTNGWQSMEEKGGLLVIRTQKDDSGDYVILSVTDSGMGISDEVQKHMFEPFYSTKSDKSSSGLGLSVVQGIVTSIHGRIDFDTTEGYGSVFSIFIPLRKKEEAVLSLSPENTQGGHILIVDDDKHITSMISSMLGMYNFSVEIFNDSEKALKALKETPHKYHMIITDLTMPKMTGSDLRNEAKKIRSDIPVLIMTGYGHSLKEDETLVLKKPFIREELIHAIDDVMKETY